MSTTTKSASRPSCYTEHDWKQATYGAYIGLVNMIKGEVTGAQFLKRNADLFKRCGVPADGKHLLSLVISMAKDCTVAHEKVRKVTSITVFRQWFNGKWAEKDAMKVVSNAGKAPSKNATTPKKANKIDADDVTKWFGSMSPAEKTAFLAKVMGEAA